MRAIYVQTYKPTWIRNIARGEGVSITTAQNCNQISSCSATPTPLCPLVQSCGNGNVSPQQVSTACLLTQLSQLLCLHAKSSSRLALQTPTTSSFWAFLLAARHASLTPTEDSLLS